MNKPLPSYLTEKWKVYEPDFGEIQVVLDDADAERQHTVLATIEDRPGDLQIARVMAAGRVMLSALEGIAREAHETACRIYEEEGNSARYRRWQAVINAIVAVHGWDGVAKAVEGGRS